MIFLCLTGRLFGSENFLGVVFVGSSLGKFWLVCLLTTIKLIAFPKCTDRKAYSLGLVY